MKKSYRNQWRADLFILPVVKILEILNVLDYLWPNG